MALNQLLGSGDRGGNRLSRDSACCRFSGYYVTHFPLQYHTICMLCQYKVLFYACP